VLIAQHQGRQAGSQLGERGGHGELSLRRFWGTARRPTDTTTWHDGRSRMTDERPGVLTL